MFGELTKESRSKVVDLCREFLGGPWTTAEEGQITVERITNGYANRNFRCFLNSTTALSSDVPLKVVVHLYGVQEEQPSWVKFIGEAAEAVILDKLFAVGMAPNIYGVFTGGRIDEYIASFNPTFDDLKDPELMDAIARQLARIHSQHMPVNKEPQRVQNILSLLAYEKQEYSTQSPCFSELEQIVFEFPLVEELKWFEQYAPRFNPRTVFSHNDLTLNNIIVRKDGEIWDERVFIIDFESSGYYYRGYDLAYFLDMRKVESDMKDDKYEQVIHEDVNEEETRKRFLNAYLAEWSILTNHLDPELDTIERLQMEDRYFSLLGDLFMLALCVRFLYDPPMLPKDWQTSEEHVSECKYWFTSARDKYLEKKKVVQHKYPEMFTV